jgi:hypothetical protein
MSTFFPLKKITTRVLKEVVLFSSNSVDKKYLSFLIEDILQIFKCVNYLFMKILIIIIFGITRPKFLKLI